MFRKSLQRRVFYVFGGFTLLLSILYTLIGLTVAYYVEDKVLENVLAQEVAHLRREFSETGQIGEPRSDYMQVYSVPEQTPEEIAHAFASGAQEIFGESGKHYHVQPVYLDQSHKPLVVADVTHLLAVRNIPQDLFSVFSLALLITILLAVGLAYTISRHTTKPILALADSILKQRDKMDEVFTGGQEAEDEIDFLDKSIHSTLEQLNTLLTRESAFNRDLSHELRTPLTIILNTLSLSDNRTLTPEEIQQLRMAAYAIKRSVTALLALARAELTSDQRFSLRQIVEECILSLHTKLQARNFDISLSMNDVKVIGNPQLATLVINNLIENAVAHAVKQRLDIKFDGSILYFTNAAVGTLPTDPTQPLIKRPDSEGFGQGLYLVRRILETLDWSFEISSPKGVFQICITPRQAS